MTDIVEKARLIATAAHGAIDQRRKYDGEPYIEHPRRIVAGLKKYYFADDVVLAAAWLHDVLEDTKLASRVIGDECGGTVLSYVIALTDSTEGIRACRKLRDRERLSESCSDVQNIKVADLIDNTSSIVQYDPSFAVVYLKEKALLLDVLTKADESLMERARVQLSESFALLNA